MDAPLRTTGLVWDDLAALPDDGNRYEVIDGVLYVTGAPSVRHQIVTGEIFGRLWQYAGGHGGRALAAPLGVVFAPSSGVQPDVIYLAPDRLDVIRDDVVAGPPTVVVEVGSPSTRERDLCVKRDLYEREGIDEYWFVDLDADEVQVFRRDETGRFAAPLQLRRGDTLTSPLLPGFAAPVDQVLGA